MSWAYSIKESLTALRRAKLSSLLSILTMTFALFFMGLFGVSISKGWIMVKKLKNQLSIEAFIQDGTSPVAISLIEANLRNQAEIEEVHLISKEEALRQYIEEFGSDVSAELGENPLPSSFRIALKADYQEQSKIEEIRSKIQSIDGIDEVIYRFDLLKLIEQYLGIAIIIAVILGALLTVSSIVLISNSIRFSILTRKDSIEIMSLVGATPGFIRRPFVIEGALQGFTASLLAMLMLYLLIWVATLLAVDISIREEWVFFLILLVGVSLGAFGSWLAIRRHLIRLLS